MPFASAPDGTRIHYRTAGERGPWVVLIQGLTLSGRFWFDIPERVAERGARLLWLDNRGTGQSDRPKRLFSMRTLARDVIAVMDHAGAERATIVGISMGGMVAQNVAVQHPERVEALVLLATTPGLPHGRLPGASMLLTLLQLPFAKGKRGAEVAARLLLPPAARHRFAELFSRWPAAFAAEPQHAATFFFQMGAVALHSTGKRLRHLQVPTVVVAGRHDALVPPENAEILARLIPEAHLELLPDCGHAIPAMDPHVIERALEHVWARLREAKPAT